MPVYDYKCPACGNRFERFLHLADYNDPQQCQCGTIAVKQLAAPAVRGDYAGYSCPVTGAWIEGRRAHEENLRKHGCRVLEPGETESVRRNTALEESRLDKAVDETADRFIAGLSTAKREQLASEVQAGATATVVRQ